MKVNIFHPSTASVTASLEELLLLKQDLTFKNEAVLYQKKRVAQNYFWKRTNPLGHAAALQELTEKSVGYLLFDEHGNIWNPSCGQTAYVRSGTVPYINQKHIIENSIDYPKAKGFEMVNSFPFDLYPYQKESIDRLIKAKHGSVELCTGAGKSAVILSLTAQLGLSTAIVVPSKSIFEEMFEKLEFHFGKDLIGTFGNGKKKIGKPVTLCIGDSLCNIKRNSEEWDFFSKIECLIVDESHSFAAETLEKVCFGVLNNLPYRFFLSGTQTRNDGGLKILQSIIGKTVHSLPTKEAKEKGYISNHEYRIIQVKSSSPSITTDDPLEAKRAHLLKNKNICEIIATVANKQATEHQKQTLIMVEELDQIAMLIPLLTVPYAIAHSEKKKDRLDSLGINKVNSKESVDKFNKSEVKVLIGTSAIQIGTNIYPTHVSFWWCGGSSPIKVKQGAIGRSIRLGEQNPYKKQCVSKDKCVIIDFDIDGVSILKNQLNKRLDLYRESGSEIKFLTLKI